MLKFNVLKTDKNRTIVTSYAALRFKNQKRCESSTYAGKRHVDQVESRLQALRDHLPAATGRAHVA